MRKGTLESCCLKFFKHAFAAIQKDKRCGSLSEASVADPEVRPLGVLDTIMRKMTNNNNHILRGEDLAYVCSWPLIGYLLKLAQGCLRVYT